ncbi:MAG: phosphopantetheine-binding protein [Casimicrobiaceae bacterium]
MTTLNAIRDILQADFDLAPNALQPEARLEDLAIDSLAVIEVMFAVEDKFHITVPAEPAAVQGELKTLGDLVAYIDRLIAEQHPSPANDA